MDLNVNTKDGGSRFGSRLITQTHIAHLKKQETLLTTMNGSENTVVK
jgi:hypothetical protein